MKDDGNYVLKSRNTTVEQKMCMLAQDRKRKMVCARGIDLDNPRNPFILKRVKSQTQTIKFGLMTKYGEKTFEGGLTPTFKVEKKSLIRPRIRNKK